MDAEADARDTAAVGAQRAVHLAGIDRAYIGGIERGQRNPTLSMIQRVAEGLEMPISELFVKVESARRKRR
jgi:transcriptional regulator with XRE-family HTH domain